MTTKIYFTIAGMNFRYGTAVAERGMTVTLQKDPANEYDHEAIKVNLPGLGQVGWVANSVGTVLGESYYSGDFAVLFVGSGGAVGGTSK